MVSLHMHHNQGQCLSSWDNVLNQSRVEAIYKPIQDVIQVLERTSKVVSYSCRVFPTPTSVSTGSYKLLTLV